ncbi:MAG: TonB family protein [Byssovorax sp.]
MAKRALLLASLMLLAGCGSAASAEKGPPNDPQHELGAKERSIKIEDESTDGKKKDPGDAFAEAQGPAASAAPNVGTPPPPEEKPADKPVLPGPGTGLKAAVVDSSTPLGNGRLTQAQIAKILEQGGDVFGECYNLGAGGANKDFRATVTVKATIGPTGKVNSAEVTKSTANNPKVDACVVQAFKKVKFPAPADGATSVITFPITFNGIEMVK